MNEHDSEPMDLVRFESLLDGHGSDLKDWPPLARAAAEHLLERSAAANARLADARALEAAIAAAPSHRASSDLIARVLGDAPSMRRGFSLLRELAGLWPFGPTWRPTAALAAALILGVVTGYTAPLSTAFDERAGDGDDMVVLAYSLDQGLEDFE